MAKAELGTKRTCPETGKKFYDLNRDPIVSPYTGKTYSAADLDPAPARGRSTKAAEKPRKMPEVVETEETEEAAELVPLDEAEVEDTDAVSPEDDVDTEEIDEEALSDVVEDDDDATPDADDDDTFLETEDGEDDTMPGIIGEMDGNDDES